MKAAASLFFTSIFLSFALIWQAGCNLDGGLQDPLRPRADLQVLSFSPDQLAPTQVQTGGTQQVVSSDGLTRTTRPITSIIFPRPAVSVRVNNGVSALITGYSVTYTFQRPGNPPTGLALFGGPLNVFVDGAPVNSTLGGAQGQGPAAGAGTQPPSTQGVAGFGTGLASFDMEVISPEASDLLIRSANVIVANITFFVQDTNGNNFTVPAAVTLSSTVVTQSSGTGTGVQGR